MTSSDDVLSLVRQALDEFDDRPLEVSVRRAVRIASLVGDSKTAIRLAYELRPLGGDRTANGTDVKRLMVDPSTWGTGRGPSEEALQEYFNDRKRSGDPHDEVVLIHPLSELEYWLSHPDHAKFESVDRESASTSFRMREIVELARHRTFTALIAWERQFGYSSINESIFSAYQGQVDRLLSDGAPDLVEKFTAVYRRSGTPLTSTPTRKSPKNCPRRSPPAGGSSRPLWITSSRPLTRRPAEGSPSMMPITATAWSSSSISEATADPTAP